MRTGTAQVQPDATGISQHNRSDPDEFIADGRAGRLRQPSIFQRNPPDVIEQHISHRAKQQPELVGPPATATGSIRIQVELLFFDPVLHIEIFGLASAVVEDFPVVPQKNTKSQNSTGGRLRMNISSQLDFTDRLTYKRQCEVNYDHVNCKC